MHVDISDSVPKVTIIIVVLLDSVSLLSPEPCLMSCSGSLMRYPKKHLAMQTPLAGSVRCYTAKAKISRLCGTRSCPYLVLSPHACTENSLPEH